jgi:hypothetical protein
MGRGEKSSALLLPILPFGRTCVTIEDTCFPQYQVRPLGFLNVKERGDTMHINPGERISVLVTAIFDLHQ